MTGRPGRGGQGCHREGRNEPDGNGCRPGATSPSVAFAFHGDSFPAGWVSGNAPYGPGGPSLPSAP